MPDDLLSAEAMKQAHTALDEQLTVLERAVQPGTWKSAAELRSILESVRTRLGTHFSLEENGGYMAAVLKREPSREHAAANLLTEHHLLRELLNSLVETRRTGSSLDEATRKSVQDWIASVRDHERRENLLVEDVFNRDVGTED